MPAGAGGINARRSFEENGFAGHAGFGLHYVGSEAEARDGAAATRRRSAVQGRAKKAASAVLTGKSGLAYMQPIDAAADA